jgi:nucleoside-diphosphate-sugar epimerase
MRVVVTGAAGFIGSHLVEALVERGDEVTGIDCFFPYYDPDRKRDNIYHALSNDQFKLVEEDLNACDLQALIDGADVIYHLAGQPGVRSSWGREFDIYLSQNVLSTQKLLETAKESSTRRFVLASSSSVYGQAEHFPTRESDSPRPVSPYGVTKLAAERLCYLYGEAFGVDTICLRYFTIFGPRQRPDMAFSRFVAATLDSRPLTIIGDGRQSRDFTYVADAVAATIAAGERGTAGRIYNVAGGCQATVLGVVEVLESLIGRPLQRQHVEPVPGDPRKTGADVTAAQHDLRYEPAVSLETGLERQLEHTRSMRE